MSEIGRRSFLGAAASRLPLAFGSRRIAAFDIGPISAYRLARGVQQFRPRARTVRAEVERLAIALFEVEKRRTVAHLTSDQRLVHGGVSSATDITYPIRILRRIAAAVYDSEAFRPA